MALLFPMSSERDFFHPHSLLSEDIFGFPWVSSRKRRLNRPKPITRSKRPLPSEWKDCRDHFEAKLSVKGFNADDFHLGLNNSYTRLTIVANAEEQGEDGVVMTKRFSKSLDLPEDCLPDDLESEYKDGTLHLTVPKYVPEKRLRKNEDEDSPFEIIPKFMSGEFLDSNKSEIKDSDEAFQLNMDVSGFKPEDLQVELTPNGVINISGHFEDKSEGRHISRQVHKSFTLPKNCQLKDVKTRLDKQGKLTITAPKDPKKAIGNETRKLAINLEDNED